MKRVALAVALFAVTGCAALRPMTASSGDLSSYQKTRLARTVPERLVAEQEYLAEHPDGAWAADVRASYETEERAYFERAQSSRARAIEYLSWFPHGPHADAALAVVRAFDGHVEDDETSRLIAAAKRTTAALDARANERKAILDELLAAIAAVVRAPIGAPLDPGSELARVVAGTRPVTWGDGSTRRERYEWVLPTASGPAARELEVTLQITVESGIVVAAELRGEALVVRLAELGAGRVFADSEQPAARAYFVDVVRGALGDRFSGARCDVAPHAGLVVGRACGGIALVVDATEETDRVRIERQR